MCIIKYNKKYNFLHYINVANTKLDVDKAVQYTHALLISNGIIGSHVYKYTEYQSKKIANKYISLLKKCCGVSSKANGNHLSALFGIPNMKMINEYMMVYNYINALNNQESNIKNALNKIVFNKDNKYNKNTYINDVKLLLNDYNIKIKNELKNKMEMKKIKKEVKNKVYDLLYEKRINKLKNENKLLYYIIINENKNYKEIIKKINNLDIKIKKILFNNLFKNNEFYWYKKIKLNEKNIKNIKWNNVIIGMKNNKVIIKDYNLLNCIYCKERIYVDDRHQHTFKECKKLRKLKINKDFKEYNMDILIKISSRLGENI